MVFVPNRIEIIIWIFATVELSFFFGRILLEHDNFAELNFAQIGHFKSFEDLSAGGVRIDEEGVTLEAGSQCRRPTKHSFNRFPKTTNINYLSY